MFSMDGWVENMAGLRLADPLEAQVVLFESFKKHRNPDETLETFLPLGAALLSDYEEIIRNEKPLPLIYTELERWESTGIAFADFVTPEQMEILRRFWKHLDGDVSAFRKRFVELWKSLPAVFGDFEKQMQLAGKATSAMMYAAAARNAARPSLTSAYQAVWFAGFGQLSGAEISMIRKLSVAGKATLVWDLDALWFSTPEHEVARLFGRLGRHQVLQSSLQKSIENQHFSSLPEIEIAWCTGQEGMAAYVQNHVVKNGARPKTGLITTHTGLVPALVDNVPQGPFPYNITMGFPLQFTACFQWIGRILQWIGRSEAVDWVLLEGVFADSPQEAFAGDAYMEWQQAILYFSKEKPALNQLRQHMPASPAWLWAKRGGEWLSAFSSWQQAYIQYLTKGTLDFVTWQTIGELLQKLTHVFALLEADQQTVSLLKKLLHSTAGGMSIAIEGSQHTGIQVMGLYESRTLDFEEVLVAPAHEGKIPSAGQRNTFLSENVRHAFGLLTRRQRVEDEMYQLYRLAHRSRKITLLVSHIDDQIPSRVVEQLRYDNRFRVTETHQWFPASLPMAKSIEVQKNDFVLQQLSRFYQSETKEATATLSPSTLHDLLGCDLRFYFKKIRRLKTPPDTEGIEMSAADFGNWVHGAIQGLYKAEGMSGKMLRKQDFETMKAGWDTVQYQVWNSLSGKLATLPLDAYMIEKEIGKHMAMQFFDVMAAAIPHRWLANELVLGPAYLTENERNWVLEGRADLVLETDNHVWIIDLKTGSFETESFYRLEPDKMDKLEGKIVKKKDLFQVLLYNWLATQSPNSLWKPGRPVRSSLFYLSNPGMGLVDPFAMHQTIADNQVVFETVENILKLRLQRLADGTKPIAQTDDLNQCRYCDYASICQRN